MTVENEHTENAKQVTHDILNELKKELVEAVWKEFELKVTNTHEKFFTGLLMDHPNLNSSELKICAMVRLNMSSKEMASIMHQTPASIDVARSRLRKKFEMSTDESLLTKLMQY